MIKMGEMMGEMMAEARGMFECMLGMMLTFGRFIMVTVLFITYPIWGIPYILFKQWHK